MPIAESAVNFSLDCCSNHAEAQFLREVAGRRLPHIARDRVPIIGWSIDILGDLAGLLEASDGWAEGRKSLFLRHDTDTVTLVELFDGWAHICTADTSLARAHVTCREVAAAVRVSDPDGSSTAITFWSLNPNRFPRPMRRNIETPSWAELEANYGASARAGMARLLEVDDTPLERLILWHGPPGTGKTHALRALARAWRSWCDVAFIADPEEFFGGSPTYLFDVANDSGSRAGGDPRRRSKLVVLEDTGELMTLDARRATGQGLSRLLNLTDGLIGQGLNVMVLITTNEPLNVVHPAVMRPGRCLAEIEFTALAPAEANAWLLERGSTATVRSPTTIADLYALLAGDVPVAPERRPIGFGAALAAV